MIFLKNNLLCIVSGILSGIPFIFPKLSFLLFVTPILFVYVMYDSKRPFFHGFLFGAFFYLVNSFFIKSLDISWVFSSKALSIILPFTALIAISSIEGVFSGLFMTVFSRLKKRCRESCIAILFSAVWVFYELFTGLSLSPLGYTWARISIPFAELPAFIQTASLFGSLFISFIVILFSSSLALSLKTKNYIFMVFPLLLLVINSAVSYALYKAPDDGNSISAAAIQNGVNSSEKWNSSVSALFKEAEEEFTGESLLVFPEACFPVYLNKSPYLNALSDKAAENNVTVLIGALYKTPEQKNHTSVYLLPYSDDTNVSSKRHPVPFGEYTPILNIFSEEIRSTDIQGSDALPPLRHENISAGCLICFDSIFPVFARETVKKGANILCISTNDSWFASSDSARLHLYHSIYRCIENSRFGVRSACTGISAIIDSEGNVLSYMPQGETGRVSGTVNLKDNITLYTRFGDMPICIFSLCLILFSLYRKE